MKNMPQIKTEALVKAFFRLGFVSSRTKKSHVKMVYAQDASRFASIPNHKGCSISPGTLRNILRSSKVNVEELKHYL